MVSRQTSRRLRFKPYIMKSNYHIKDADLLFTSPLCQNFYIPPEQTIDIDHEEIK